MYERLVILLMLWFQCLQTELLQSTLASSMQDSPPLQLCSTQRMEWSAIAAKDRSLSTYLVGLNNIYTAEIFSHCDRSTRCKQGHLLELHLLRRKSLS